MNKRAFRIGLAAPRFAPSVAQGIVSVRSFLNRASEERCAIVCFPESFIPGLRGQDLDVPQHNQTDQQRALDDIRDAAASAQVAAIIPMEWESGEGLLNCAVVVSASGDVIGVQTKNQIAPEEEGFYVPGRGRRLFEVGGVKFGIAICHEGWRYPETVRWAAARGAQVVFHPHHTGSDKQGVSPRQWGAPDSPYYEKAMMCRSIENTIYFASVNYAMRFQESATSVIAPDGRCAAHLPYGEEGLLVADLDLDAASGFLARRFDPSRHTDEDTQLGSTSSADR